LLTSVIDSHFVLLGSIQFQFASLGGIVYLLSLGLQVSVSDLESTLHLAQKTYSFNNSLKNQYFRSILFGIGMPQTSSTCPYRFPLEEMCLVYPQKFEHHIVPWFVTPCGIWPQHDQIDPFSNYKKGKSESIIIWLKISTFVALEG